MKTHVLGVDVVNKIFESNRASTNLRFKEEVRTNSTFLNLRQHHRINIELPRQVDRIIQTDSLFDRLSEFHCCSSTFEFRVCWLSNLNFELVTSAKLVFYVLGTTKALEDATSNHNSHFSRKRFGLFHTMCREYHGALFVSL